MFGSTNPNPFGQSSNSPFGSPSSFGQPSNTTNNNPFGAQPSTGVFGATQSPSPAFGASSSPSFGSSITSFGASTTPAFGTSASSVFGQKPAFGGFGSSTAQASPFGSTFQQPQAAFVNNQFGCTQFGASSQPAFGASTTPVFGSASSSPAFGVSNTQGATSIPAFGSTTTPAFGSTGSVFGASTSPVFGSGSAFGVFNTPTFGTPGTPAFGVSTTPAFGASSAPSFSSGPSPVFGQSTSTFGTSAFGAQATTPLIGSSGFKQSAFGGQRGGSRVTAYLPTPEVDDTSQSTAGMLESILAMPVYKEKSHEELRWEDYQLGDKGGPSSTAQSSGGGIGFGSTNTQSNPFGNSPTYGQSSANPSTTPYNPFGSKPAFGDTSGIGTPSTTFGSSPFGTTTTSNAFGSTSSAMSSIFGSLSSTAFGQSPSLFGSAPATGATQAFGSGMGFGNTQPSPLFQSTTPSLGQMNPVFKQNISSCQTNPSFGQTNPAFGQSHGFSTPSTGFGGIMFSSTSSLLSTSGSICFGQTTPSLSTPFQPAQLAQTAGSFGFGSFGQTQSAGTSGFGGTDMFGQSNFGHSENPRALVIRPLEQWPPRSNSEKSLPLKEVSAPRYGNEGGPVENGKKQPPTVNLNHKLNGVKYDITSTRLRAGEAAAIVYKHGADFAALMPKLRHVYYYMEPRMHDLAVKEKLEPGFCGHVKDFVIGRHGYGSIRFIRETDVRGLDIESLVQFNNREVIVYMDETKKHPVGQGLNKPAEVTLLNIKCFSKKTGLHYTKGPKIDRFMDMLRRKAEDQGAKFVSYDPIREEWKFSVSHFSTYSFGTEDEEEEDDCNVLDC